MAIGRRPAGKPDPENGQWLKTVTSAERIPAKTPLGIGAVLPTLKSTGADSIYPIMQDGQMSAFNGSRQAGSQASVTSYGATGSWGF